MRTDPILISTIFNDQLEKLVYKKPIVKPLTAKTKKVCKLKKNVCK